ncbi:hypothetical protein NSE_0868 [Neorickettsia sennetsu str. Miyayama]|uniref:Uncharacterized protein n=1 Tax=Ehrlichia sennetsu (strain ATCC VR-367 / Miyayama) TaxID=222891 RepID=Q2GCR1_EHRS3|nr:hypothetical protein NSE_0868 [Neorickettsia sennetsu str. Miyayama]
MKIETLSNPGFDNCGVMCYDVRIACGAGEEENS